MTVVVDGCSGRRHSRAKRTGNKRVAWLLYRLAGMKLFEGSFRDHDEKLAKSSAGAATHPRPPQKNTKTQWIIFSA